MFSFLTMVINASKLLWGSHSIPIKSARDVPQAMGILRSVFRPSLQFLETALAVMALCSFVMGVGMFFLMQARYSRNLARGTRRLSFANLIGSNWDAKHLGMIFGRYRRAATVKQSKKYWRRRRSLSGTERRRPSNAP